MGLFKLGYREEEIVSILACEAQRLLTVRLAELRGHTLCIECSGALVPQIQKRVKSTLC